MIVYDKDRILDITKDGTRIVTGAVVEQADHYKSHWLGIFSHIRKAAKFTPTVWNLLIDAGIVAVLVLIVLSYLGKI